MPFTLEDWYNEHGADRYTEPAPRYEDCDDCYEEEEEDYE